MYISGSYLKYIFTSYAICNNRNTKCSESNDKPKIMSVFHEYVSGK
jgi:hypothetical protein